MKGFRKGNIPWNKGLSKDTDERLFKGYSVTRENLELTTRASHIVGYKNGYKKGFEESSNEIAFLKQQLALKAINVGLDW